MTLSPDGKVLTVDYFIDDSRGSFELSVFSTKPDSNE